MSRKVKDKKNYRMYNETLYEVQRVVQIKWVKNKQYCLIKWRGYDEKFNTWEPKDHITFCYNYEAPEEKDDDPEYVDKTPVSTPTSHHYQTRTKKTSNPEAVAKNLEVQEKQDHTQLEEQSGGPNTSFNLFPIEKPIKEVSKELLEIRRKGESQHYTASKEDLVSRVLELSADKNNQKRMGKVQTLDGKIIFLREDILKARYPEKVIEYYEQQLKGKSIRCD